MFQSAVKFTSVSVLAFLSAGATVEARSIKACMALYPPYVMREDDGQITGVHTEILRQMADDMGYQLEIEELPWKRCLKMAERGEVDIVYSASFNEDRAGYLYYPSQHLRKTQYIFVIKENADHGWDHQGRVETIPQPIGSVNGHSISIALDQIENVEIDDGATSDASNLRKFENGRVPSVIIAQDTYDSLRGTLSIPHEVLDPPFMEKRYYITLSRKAFGGGDDAQKLYDQMNDYLAALAQSGELERLHERLRF